MTLLLYHTEPPSAASPLPNTAALEAALADRYRIERELGRGGMATVYLAQDLRHDRPVALKVLRPELAATLGPERFLHEIRIAAGLQHPHILPVFDSGDAAGQLWYTMPYVAGETLRERLIREKQLPLDDARRIALQVLSALEYAHGHGVIHRDIKPENILLEDDQAVVADLGIARAMSAVGEDRLTETGLSLGTPAYMSPEQACAEPNLDRRTDLYSLGCVLYEMLVGERPTQARRPRPSSLDVSPSRLRASVPPAMFPSLLSRRFIARSLGTPPTGSPRRATSRELLLRRLPLPGLGDPPGRPQHLGGEPRGLSLERYS